MEDRIVEAEYVSILDEGEEVRTGCWYHLEKNIAFGIDLDVDDSCTMQYVELEDGTERQTFYNRDGDYDVYMGERE